MIKLKRITGSDVGLLHLFTKMDEMLPMDLVQEVDGLTSHQQQQALNKILDIIGLTIRSWVETCGVSTKRAAAAMGVSHATYKQITRNGCCPPGYVMDALYILMPEMRRMSEHSLKRMSVTAALLRMRIEHLVSKPGSYDPAALKQAQEEMGLLQAPPMSGRASILEEDEEYHQSALKCLNTALHLFHVTKTPETVVPVAFGETVKSLQKLLLDLVAGAAFESEPKHSVMDLLAINGNKWSSLIDGTTFLRSAEIQRLLDATFLLDDERELVTQVAAAFRLYHERLRPAPSPAAPIVITKEEPQPMTSTEPMSPLVPLEVQNFLRRGNFHVAPNASRTQALEVIREAYGVHVKKSRESLEISPNKAANLIGIDRNTMRKFEAGRAWIEGDTWRRLARTIPPTVIPELSYIRAAVKDLSLPAPAQPSAPPVAEVVPAAEEVKEEEIVPETPAHEEPSPAPIAETMPEDKKESVPASLPSAKTKLGRTPFHIALYNARIASKMSRQEVGDLLHVEDSAVGHWESNSNIPIREHYEGLKKLFPELNDAIIPPVREIEKPNSAAGRRKKDGPVSLPTPAPAPTPENLKELPMTSDSLSLSDFKNKLRAVKAIKQSPDFELFKSFLEQASKEGLPAQELVEMLDLIG